MEVTLVQYTSPAGRIYTFSLVNEFFNICPDLQSCSPKELIDEYKVFSYCHSTTGPACYGYIQGTLRETYYLFGKAYETREEWEKEKNRLEFNDKLKAILND